MKNRIKELEKIIVALDTAFENGDDCINPITGQTVLDNEYDALKSELFTLNPNSKIFTSVTASKNKIKGDKVIHDPPMTSINKCNGTEKEKEKILEKWMKDCGNNGDKKFFCMSYKHDGLALSIEYKDGKISKAGLRSKSGKDGINVTEKCKYIKGIPQQLPDSISCIVRGEIETSKTEFKKQCEILEDKAKANCRAHTAGSMNQKTAEQMKNRGLQFVAYNIIGLENPPYTTEVGRAEWAERKLKLNFVKTIPFTENMLKIFEDRHRKLDFMVDGVVLSVNDLEIQKELGNTGDKDTGNPRGKIAWKFKDEVKKTVVKEIQWQTGRTGTITPVLIVEPVDLEGTTVTKCTAHNAGIVDFCKIGVGSEIEIIKSGKIIPKLHTVITEEEVILPEKCNSCEGNLSEKDGADHGWSLICTNKDCPAQNVKSLNHFLTVLGVKGISESTVNKLIEAGLLQKRSDFYELWFDKLIKNGFTERTAILIDARVQMIKNPEAIKDNKILISMVIDAHNSKKEIELEKFIASFGIEGSGKEIGRILQEKYRSIEKIKNLSIENLEDIDGIGPITAKNVYEFFRDNEKEINNLLRYIKLKTPKVVSGKFSGKNFVLSGSLNPDKSYWKKEIESKGGIIKSSVSKKTNYLIAGEGSGLKSEKASKLGVPILTTEELEQMIKG